MISKNKQNKENRYAKILERKLGNCKKEKRQLQKSLNGERKHHRFFFFVVLILLVAIAISSWAFYRTGERVGEFRGYEDGYQKCKAEVSETSEQQTLDQHSEDGGTTKTTNKARDNIGTSAIVSAYCLQGTMANGEKAHQGAVACPRDIPLGTKLVLKYPDDTKVSGFQCTDRMAQRYDCTNGQCIEERWDIWMDSCSKAKEYGVKELKIIK